MADLTYLFQRFLQHPDVERQPRGSGEAKAWCPFHQDRDAGGQPSLGINPTKEIVKCWSSRCGKGGPKALAEAWGIPFDQDTPAPQQEIERTYDYLDADGQVLFQVVRFRYPKDFRQRRPDPEKPGEWLWNLKGISTVLYRLPELRAADQEAWVWIVEGEKDADRLHSLGQVATCNAMGAGKWWRRYNRELKDRKVAILPDQDPAGADHAAKVASAALTLAAEVKVVKLPDLPEKGDVSDWLDQGHTTDELLDLLGRTPPYEPPPEGRDTAVGGENPEWKVSQLRPHAIRIISLLQTHGYFVNGHADAYFFDKDARRLVLLDRDERDLRILLDDRYQVNRQDQLYSYLLEMMLVEAHLRGKRSLVRQFSYYDADANLVYLDMGNGRVLKVSANSVEVRDNGQDGVLFLPMPDQEPWDYNPGYTPRVLAEQMIAPVNFTDENETFTVADQQLLLLLWLISFAFESMMPTKVIVMAVGPGESGKSSLLRNVGRMLIGPEFEVDSILQDQKGEDDFWVNLSHSFFACYDNVDQTVRWLPDALAQVATGVRRSKRQLHTTNQMSRFKVSCMVGVTARTPTVSLRREDVASRTLIFSLKRLEAKRAEGEIQDQLARLRSEMMSNFVSLVQRTLRVPLSEVQVADPGMRMADFARVATRIGKGLGGKFVEQTDAVIKKVRTSQNRFATEEDALTSLLGLWICRSKPLQPGEMDVGAIPNEGREISAADLCQELNAIAKEFDMKQRFQGPTSLGIRLRNMEHALSQEFEVTRGRGKTSKTWTFYVKQDQDQGPAVE